MKCLDTDFLVDVLRGNEKAKEKMRSLDDEGVQTTTVVNAYELLAGARLDRNESEAIRSVLKILAKLEVLIFDFESANIASRHYADLSKQGALIEARDLFIASMAQAKNL